MGYNWEVEVSINDKYAIGDIHDVESYFALNFRL